MTTSLRLVFGVDPGLLTGLCLVHHDPMTGDLSRLWSIEADMHTTVSTLKYDVPRALSSGYPVETVLVAMESFIINARTVKNQQAPYSLKTIGAVEQGLWEVDFPEERLVMQTPGAAKSVVSDDKLKRLGLWHRGGEGHARDALRHAVLAFINTGWSSPKLLPQNDK